MKTRIQFNFLLLLLILISFSCKKDNHQGPSLPPATQNGNNTMAAMVNGEIWSRFSCISCQGGGSGLVATLYAGSLQIIGDSVSSTKVHSTVEISLTNVSSAGVYTLGPVGGNGITNNAEIMYTISNNIALYYFTDAVNTGSVNITRLDAVKHIISGTFSFNAANQNNPSDTKHVTEGRFDIPYISD